MTTENFTWDNVIAAMKKAVETNGEGYVYAPTRSSYSYTNPDGTPSCIVGHVLAEVAPETYGRVLEAEDEGDTSCTWYVLARGNFIVDVDGCERSVCGPITAPTERETELLRNALGAAQRWQDHHGTWGEAYDRFLAVLGLDREDVQ